MSMMCGGGETKIKATGLCGIVFVICLASFQLSQDIRTSHSFLSRFNTASSWTTQHHHHHHQIINASDTATTTASRQEPVLVFDLVSIGSYNRPHHQKVQRNTFGSHRHVRHFFRITEDDDADQACHTNLTNDEAFQVSKFCRWKKWEDHRFVMRYMRRYFARIAFLKNKANPAGWLCAQKRSVHGFAKAMTFYREQMNTTTAATTSTTLPDYLVIMDDDTYLNMDRVSSFLNKSDHNIPLAIAGCMIRSPIREINFTTPYGGWGMFYSKAALENMLRPIRCEKREHAQVEDDAFLQDSCKALQDNQLGELDVFQEGMSLSEVMQAFVSSQPYTDLAHWKNGFCLHGDWVWGYFSNFYPVSIHDPDPFYQDVRHARMQGYNGSELYGGSHNAYKRKQCDYEFDKCTTESHICHYQSPERMERLSSSSSSSLGSAPNKNGSVAVS